MAFPFESVKFADQGIPLSSPEKFLGVDGSQHRNPLLINMRTWEISALEGMSISYSSSQGSGMWKRSRKTVRTRGGEWLQRDSIFQIQQGKMQYELELTKIARVCRISAEAQATQSPRTEKGKWAQKTPSQKAIHN